FGTTNPPPLLRAGLPASARSQPLDSLSAGATYFWRVAGKTTCVQAGEVSSAIASFTTRSACGTPGATALLFVPPAVSAGAPYAIFTVPPAARITNLGEKLEDSTGSFTIENIGAEAVQVFVGRQELGGSRPFFNIVEDAAFVTLQPRTPRTFTILFSGPPSNVPELG